MECFVPNLDNSTEECRTVHAITIGNAQDLTVGRCARVQLPDGGELAVFNVDGEFHATENFCPHKGAPLSEGTLRGHVIECMWHGRQFDVRNGNCLPVGPQLKVYPVILEDGVLKIEI